MGEALEFIALKKCGDEWVRSTLGIELPPRKGCRIQQHHPSSGLEQWQLWYPKLKPDDADEPASHQKTGENSLQLVVDWAWKKHKAWQHS